MAKITEKQAEIIKYLEDARHKSDAVWMMAMAYLQGYFGKVTEHLESCQTTRREKIHLYAKTPQQSGS